MTSEVNSLSSQVHSTIAPAGQDTLAKRAPHVPSVAGDELYAAERPALAASLSRPRLAEFAMIQTTEKLHRFGSEYLDMEGKSLDSQMEYHRSLNAENAQKILEAAKLSQESGVWDMLKKIGATIMAALSTVFGFSLLATGGGSVVAGVLIASGILAVANLALTETGIWNRVAEKLAADNKEKQEKLKVMIPAAIGTLCALVSFAGSAGAVLWAPLNFMQAAIATANTAVNFGLGITNMGSAVSESRHLFAQSALTEIQHKLTMSQITLDRNSSFFEKFLAAQSQVFAKASEIITLSINNYRNMHIQG